jgi:hypothetical protein
MTSTSTVVDTPDEIHPLGRSSRRCLNDAPHPPGGDKVHKGSMSMAIVTNQDPKTLIADKAALRRMLEEQDKLTGFVLDPTATPQKARQLMLADGVHPEENIGSRAIIQMREGEEE